MSVSLYMHVIVFPGAIGGRDHMDDGIVAIVTDHFARQPHVMQHGVPDAMARMSRDVEHTAVHKDDHLTAGITKLGDLNEAVFK